MATRMQQRRGTAAQWTSADPILAAAEIGFESDTGKFKIGDGINHWSTLTYYASAADIAGLIDGAPDLLNTLNEIAAAIGDDPDFINTMASKNFVVSNVDVHNADTTDVHGILDTAQLATKDYADTSATNASAAAQLLAEGYADTAIDTHNGTTTNVHGILDTSVLATQTDVLNAKNNAEAFATDAISTHNLDTTSVHGIADTTLLATQSDIADAETFATNAVSTHNLDTTDVHGIADTAALALLSDVALKQDKVTGVSDTEIGYLDGVTSAIQTQLDGKADSSHSHAQSDITDLTTDLAAKAPLASPTFTGTVTAGDVTINGDLTVSGTTTTVSAQDLVVSDPLIYIGEGNTANLVDLGVVSSFNDGTYQHSGIVRDASAGKWKVFKGVIDEPTTIINFAQGSLDDLAVNNVEVAGVVFSDGTQTKEGVVSRTPIIQKTDSYTLSTLTERDSLIEVNKASAATVTILPRYKP